MTQTQNFELPVEITLENPGTNSETCNFDKIFLEAVDSAFSMLGESNKRTLYCHLKKICGIDRADIPNHVGTFVEVLEEIFGQAASMIEMGIMHALHRKVPSFIFSTNNVAFSFTGYAEALRLFCS